MTPHFFERPSVLRQWFAANHRTAAELWVGFYTRASGKPSLTYHEALDEALAIGWIDGVRRSLDGTSYTIRFSPRRPRSIWSAVNVARARALIRARRMKRTGRTVFDARDQARTNRYSYERQTAALSRAQLRRFKADHAAWQFFQAQPAGYRRVAAWYVVSARQEVTRSRRLEALIAHSRHGRRLPPLVSARDHRQ